MEPVFCGRHLRRRRVFFFHLRVLHAFPFSPPTLNSKQSTSRHLFRVLYSVFLSMSIHKKCDLTKQKSRDRETNFLHIKFRFRQVAVAAVIRFDVVSIPRMFYVERSRAVKLLNICIHSASCGVLAPVQGRETGQGQCPEQGISGRCPCPCPVFHAAQT